MQVLNLYSYHKKAAEGGTPDVFTYDKLPERLRIQIIHIWREAIGRYFVYSGFPYDRAVENNEDWEVIHDQFAKERGVFNLGGERQIDSRCENYFVNCKSVEIALDLVDYTFLYIDKVAREFSSTDREIRGIKVTASDAIKQLN